MMQTSDSMPAIGAPLEAPLLLIQNLSKTFDGVRAVNDVSIAIQRGEIFALLGSSGCGKSTLLRMLAGFETPTSGQILLQGVDMVGVPPYQRPINMMFQSYALFPHLSVWDNIAFGLRRDGMHKDKIAEIVEKMLALVQLQAYGKRKPHQLSGGQQQRVALARSLAKKPQLLLLDEPLGALDKKLREQTQTELVNIIEQVGVTCVMVTHDQEEAMSMASRIAVMHEGRILQLGKPHEIYETPNCRFVADFIGNVNVFNGTLTLNDATHARVSSPECAHEFACAINASVGMSVSLGIRPEKIALRMDVETDIDSEASTTIQPGLSEANCVAGEVISLAYLGSHTIYHVKLASDMLLKVALMNAVRHVPYLPQRGDRVVASWHAEDVVVLTQ